MAAGAFYLRRYQIRTVLSRQTGCVSAWLSRRKWPLECPRRRL